MTNRSSRSVPNAGPLRIDADAARNLPVFEASSQPGLALKSLAQDLDQLGSQAGAWADQATANEATRAGQEAGNQDSYKPRRGNTIYDMNFDAAGNKQLLQKEETAARAELMQATLDYGQNPAALKSASEKIRAKYGERIGAVAPELRGDLEGSLQRIGDSYTFQASRQFMEQQREDARQLSVVRAGQQETDLVRIARSGPGNPKAAVDLEAGMERFKRDVEANPELRPAQQAALIQRATGAVGIARIEAEIDAVTDPKALDRFEETLKSDWGAKKGAFAKLSADQFDAAVTAINRRRNEMAKDLKAEGRQVTLSLDEVETRVMRGESPGDQRWGAARALLAQRGDQAALGRLDQLEQLSRVGRGFRAASDIDQRATLQSLDERAVKSGLSDGEEKMRTMFRAIHQERLKDKEQDPLGTASKNLGFKVSPLEFGAADFGAQARRRVSEAEQLAKETGQAPVYLQRDERDRLRQLAQAEPDKAVAAVREISAGFGDRSQRVLREVAQDMPTMAYVMRPGNTRLMEDWAKSRTAEKEGVKLPAVNAQDVAKFMTDEGHKALFTGREIEMGKIAMAAAPIIAQRVGVGGKFDINDAASKEIARGVVQDLLGRQKDVRGRDMSGPADVNGARTIAPASVPADNFNRIVSLITAEDLKAAGATPKTGRVSDVTGARWVPVAANRYRLAIGDPAKVTDPWLSGEDGKALEIDLSPGSALMTRLRQRAPRLF